MAKKKHHVAIVLDETGSMMSIKEATVNGYNEFLDTLRNEKPKPRLTLVRFNSNGIKIAYTAKKLKKVERLTTETYNPDAMTPLHDAIGVAVRELKALMEDEDTALVMVITDGQENSSQEYTLSDVKALIAECEKTDRWTFTYLGANVDAFAEGGKLGMATQNVAAFGSTPTSTRHAFLRMSKAVSSHMRNEGKRSSNLMADDD